MGFMCVKGKQECNGCMDCETSPIYYCPICGEEVYEAVFVDKDGDAIGCDRCVEIKEPHEVLDNEAN